MNKESTNKKGSIKPNGVVLKDHENATVVFLTEQGYDIELIPKSNVEGVHTADIRISDFEWEIKAPKGQGKWVLKNTVKKALRQSENIIIDLRRIKLPQSKCLPELENHFKLSKRAKRMIVITKSRKMLEFSK